MYLKVGGISPHKGHYPHISHDSRIYAAVTRLSDKALKLCYLAVGGQSVAGEMHLYTPVVSLFYGIGKPTVVKVCAPRPHAEVLLGKVHRIRPVIQGGIQPFLIPCGGEHLKTFTHQSVIPASIRFCSCSARVSA